MPFLKINRFEAMTHANRPKYKFNFLNALCLIGTFKIFFGRSATFIATPYWPESYWLAWAFATTIVILIALLWIWVWKANNSKNSRIKHALRINDSSPN